jgi:hypothetical protein
VRIKMYKDFRALLFILRNMRPSSAFDSRTHSN